MGGPGGSGVGPTRVTPPHKGDEVAPAGATPKSQGARAPVTPPKAGPPKPGILKTPPGSGAAKAEKKKEEMPVEKKGIDAKKVKSTPKSPPPQGLSPYSSESVSGGSQAVQGARRTRRGQEPGAL